MDIIQNNKNIIKDKILTLEEAADLACVSKHTIRSWTQKNLISSTKIKGRYGMEITISKIELLKYLKESIPKTENPKPKKSKDDKEVKQTETESTTTSNLQNMEVFEIDMNDYIEILKNSLKSAQKQLEQKDEQINSLMDKLTQANTLTLNAQNLALNSQEEKKQLKEEVVLLRDGTKRKRFLGLF